MGDSAVPELALEVPLLSEDDDFSTTVVHIDADSDVPEIRPFPARSCAGISKPAPAVQHPEDRDSRLYSRVLIWSIEETQPNVLNVRDMAVCGKDSTEDVVRFEFNARILPSVVAVCEHGEHRICLITADARLHVVSLVTNVEGGNSLRNQVMGSTRGGGNSAAVETFSLKEELERLGCPTCVTCVDGLLCIGTSQGVILCIPSLSSVSVSDAFELNPAAGMLGGIGTVLSSFMGRNSMSAVEQMVPLAMMNQKVLCCIHFGSVFRVWDVQSRRFLITIDLLPHESASTTHAVMVRSVMEPLDSSTSLLIVVFRCLEEEQSFGDKLCVFELHAEDRGGVLKIHVESGPRLEGVAHRVVDVLPQHYDRRKLSLWLLYDDACGDRKIDLVPVDFSGNQHVDAVEVILLEDQISHELSDVDDMKEAAANAMVRVLSKTCVGLSDPVDGFLDLFLAAGCFYKQSIEEVVRELGSESAITPNLESYDGMKRSLRELVDNINQRESEDAEASVQDWMTVLKAYNSSIGRRHRPIALLQQSNSQREMLLIARSNNLISGVVPLTPPESIDQGAISCTWVSHLDAPSVTIFPMRCVMKAMEMVLNALGSKISLVMMRKCLLQDATQREKIFSAVVSLLLSSGDLPRPSSTHSHLANGFMLWQGLCRSLPLKLGRIFSHAESSDNIISGLETMANLLGQRLIPYERVDQMGSTLRNFSRCMTTLAITRARQHASAQFNCIISLKLLVKFIASVPALGTLPLRGMQERLAQLDTERLDPLLTAAQIAYWATSIPMISMSRGAASGSDMAVDGLEINSSILSLRLGGDGMGSGGVKRSKITVSIGDGTYVGEHLLEVFRRDAPYNVPNLSRVQNLAEDFGSWLLAADVGEHLHPQKKIDQRKALARAFDLISYLLKANRLDLIAGLLNQISDDHLQDPRILFCKGCSLAYQASSTNDEDARMSLEDDSIELFFYLASLFLHEQFFAEQLREVLQSLQYISLTRAADAVVADTTRDDTLRYLEALKDMYDRLGLPRGSSRFALAAAKHVVDLLPGEENSEPRAHHAGRLWSSIFSGYIEEEAWEEAYASLLGNEAGELQVDCVHRLVNELCHREKILTLCSLPFAHNAVILRSGTLQWVSILDEAVAALERRAINSDAQTMSQPYKVLFDFYTSRSNHQAAASAMVTYARRLLAESSGNVAPVKEISGALTVAVASLRLVPDDHAWIEDPTMSLHKGSQAPAIITVEDLRRECALFQARAAITSRAPNEMNAWLRSGIDDVFLRLLELGECLCFLKLMLC